MQESYMLSLGDLKATIKRNDGRVYTQGYDVESERIALLLNRNLGEGLGVILVALSECSADQSLEEIMQGFERDIQGYAKIDIRSMGYHPTSPLTPLYFSYSPDYEVRQWAVFKNDFPLFVWRRLLDDENESVVATVLARAKLPKEIQTKYSQAPNEEFRKGLARNPNLDISVAMTLANDDSSFVRMALGNWSASNLPLVVQKAVAACNAQQQGDDLVTKAQQHFKRAKILRKDVEDLLKEQESKEL